MNRHLNLDEKLAVLQEADSYRKWYSLDDRRVCILCERLINGRMIDIWQDDSATYRLHCPTPGCSGAPRDWFYCGFKGTRRPHVPQEPRPDLQLQFLGQIDSRGTRKRIQEAESATDYDGNPLFLK